MAAPERGLKARECGEFLERLEAEGALVLADKRRGRAPGSVTRVPLTASGEPGRPLLGSVRDIEPLRVELVGERAERLPVAFRETEKHYRRILDYQHLWILKAHLDEEDDGALAETRRVG